MITMRHEMMQIPLFIPTQLLVALDTNANEMPAQPG
jgi:hypothetical protein